MNDGDSPCAFVVDCAGLHEIATTKSNTVRSVCLDHLSKGSIAVPACVWQEFETLYEDEAAALAPHVKRKLRMKKSYLIGGAAIADSMNPVFPMSPYDGKTDYYAASICSIEGYTLITAGYQMKEYAKMNCCTVVEVSDWSSNPTPPVKK
jgi:hypothetical protein